MGKHEFIYTFLKYLEIGWYELQSLETVRTKDLEKSLFLDV